MEEGSVGMNLLQENGYADLEGVWEGRGRKGCPQCLFRVVLMLEMQILCVVVRAA